MAILHADPYATSECAKKAYGTLVNPTNENLRRVKKGKPYTIMGTKGGKLRREKE